jgi:uncharacterized membrane protein SpoIIM required for sporulation
VSDDLQTPWSVRFRREREPSWRELEDLVARCDRHGIRGVGPEKLARLAVLYRAAASSLGVARSSVLDRNLLEWLEALVARAYLVVYAPQRRAAEVAREFLLAGFPAAVRSIAWHTLAAAMLIVLGAALAWTMVAADSEAFYLFVNGSRASGRDPSATTESLRATLFDGGNRRNLLDFAARLFTHNASVSILVYGLGFVFGLPVVLLLVYNGMAIGAMSALFHSRGLAVEWWSWILPHGVTELTAIALAGGAGLAMAGAMLFPGRSTRVQALCATGRRMGAVVAGGVVMLLLAALVEGVFRQIVTHVPSRYALASIFGGLWAAFFALAGRRPR